MHPSYHHVVKNRAVLEDSSDGLRKSTDMCATMCLECVHRLSLSLYLSLSLSLTHTHTHIDG
jgi:hypothetical protein